MKYVFLFAFAAMAAFMGYKFMEGECPGGQVFANAAECRAKAGDAAFCRDAFAMASRKAREDYSPFPTQDDCLRSFPACEPHARVTSGFVPVPRAFCVARGPRGAEGTPLYGRIGQRIQ